MSKLTLFWNKLSSEWRFAIGAFVVARLALLAWSLVVFAILPIALQNLDLFNGPVLTLFNLQTSERYIYLRMVDGEVLTFRALDTEYMVDDQTGSIWSMSEGYAVRGQYEGTSLGLFPRSVEEVFPYLGVPPAKNVLLALWQRFDTNWYLKIAARGYGGSDGSTAFFPLYSLIIRALSLIMEPMLAALLISNLALLGTLVVLHRLISGIADVQTTQRSLIYFLAFPTAFFLLSGYNESLFLLFTSACLYSASNRHWGWSAIWGALAALTRLQGVLLIMPLAYMLWRDLGLRPVKRLIVSGLPLGIIPVASFLFLAYSRMSLFSTLQQNWNARFVFPWETIWAAVSLSMSDRGTIVDMINLVVTLGLIVILFAVWKKIPFEYTLYSASMLIVPLFRMSDVQPLVSITRYALAAFPVFIVLGMWGRNQWVNRAILYVSVSLQLYLSAQFLLWGWVA